MKKNLFKKLLIEAEKKGKMLVLHEEHLKNSRKERKILARQGYNPDEVSFSLTFDIHEDQTQLWVGEEEFNYSEYVTAWIRWSESTPKDFDRWLEGLLEEWAAAE